MAAVVTKESSLPRVAVLGGGNGTSHLLRSLLPLLHDQEIASLHALVHMADDGGSTGRLRKQYDVGAMGDLTRCLLSLSAFRGDVRGEEFLRALEYRFADGDFQGHTLRNALLAALELTSDLDAAIATFARILQIPKYSGVVPMTLKPLTQRVVVQENGQSQVLGEGQHFISWNVNLQQHPHWGPETVRVTFAEDDISLNPRAKEVLESATHIIVAPGHTYGSILPTLASVGLGDEFALSSHNAQNIAVMTLLTTPNHTVGWSGEDFMRSYETHFQDSFDVVVANTGRVDIDLVPGQDWVDFGEKDHAYEMVKQDLVQVETKPPQAGDVVQRAVLVHDPSKMRQVFRSLF